MNILRYTDYDDPRLQQALANVEKCRATEDDMRYMYLAFKVGNGWRLRQWLKMVIAVILKSSKAP